MQEIGKVTEYNGYYGKIVGLDNREYLFLKNQIMTGEKINPLDDVSFVPENYLNGKFKENIARFIKKYNKKV